MERQASKKFYNKCSDNSSSQIVFRTDIFRKLTLGAPVFFFFFFLAFSAGAKIARERKHLPFPAHIFESFRPGQP